MVSLPARADSPPRGPLAVGGGLRAGPAHATRRLAARPCRWWRGLRLLIALMGAVAIMGTQQFLSVHALHHLGETDHTHCEYAPLAATAGGGVLGAVAALPAPCVAGRVEMPPPRHHASRAPLPTRRARAPPLA